MESGVSGMAGVSGRSWANAAACRRTQVRKRLFREARVEIAYWSATKLSTAESKAAKSDEAARARAKRPRAGPATAGGPRGDRDDAEEEDSKEPRPTTAEGRGFANEPAMMPRASATVAREPEPMPRRAEPEVFTIAPTTKN